MTRTASPTVESHRLFFALWPHDDVRQAMRAVVQGAPVFEVGGRRVAPAKYHVTLHFLGTWPTFPDDVADAARRAAASVDASAFHLVIDHAGGFSRSRVGWIAPGGNSGLDALWASLGHALAVEGVQRRAADTFSPHVTVLRGLRDALAGATIDPLSWPVEDFVLVHSHDDRYDVIGRWPLATG